MYGVAYAHIVYGVCCVNSEDIENSEDIDRDEDMDDDRTRETADKYKLSRYATGTVRHHACGLVYGESVTLEQMIPTDEERARVHAFVSEVCPRATVKLYLCVGGDFQVANHDWVWI
jgi:hypothetical protein